MKLEKFGYRVICYFKINPKNDKYMYINDKDFRYIIPFGIVLVKKGKDKGTKLLSFLLYRFVLEIGWRKATKEKPL